MADTTTAPEVVVQATRYEVSVLPLGDINRRYFTLYVELRGDQWAITNGFGECMEGDGLWSHDSAPSEDAEKWRARNRFGFDTALALAKKYAPQIAVNGRTAADMYDHTYGGAAK